MAAAFPLRAAADSVCNSGEFCIWGNPGFGGDFWDPSTDDPHWDFFNVENDDDAVRNRESVKVHVYASDNYTGTLLYCVEPFVIEDDIADVRDNDGDSNLTFDSTGLTDCGTLPAP
jgi:hypothetical protein